jgi:hypothetical protein
VEILEIRCNDILNIDKQAYDETSFELNDKLLKFALDHTKRQSDGRLIMPLLWDPRVADRLGTNRSLAEKILFSNLKKLRKSPEKLTLLDQAIREQAKAGIIERIDNLDQFLS